MASLTAAARPYIVGIGGTTRPGSSAERALAYALSVAEVEGADTEMFDGPSVNLPMYPTDTRDRTPEALNLIAALRRADGIILSTPCYHGSISGLLKNALDYAEDLARDPQPYFDGRAVGLIVCGYGWQSTAITLTALRSIVHALRGWPTPMGVALNTAQSATAVFDELGRVTDEAGTRQIGIMVGQVLDFARLRMHKAAMRIM